MRICVIVAVAENGVVGVNNTLPWHIPADLKYFKKVTMGKPVVMGRKTFESIGKPLPGRANIVVSRNRDFAAPGVTVVTSMEGALELAGGIAASDGKQEFMVIGGAAIYVAAIPLADCLLVTEVHASVEGDAYLPTVDWSQWRQESRERHRASEPGNPDFSFVVYRRC